MKITKEDLINKFESLSNCLRYENEKKLDKLISFSIVLNALYKLAWSGRSHKPFRDILTDRGKTSALLNQICLSPNLVFNSSIWFFLKSPSKRSCNFPLVKRWDI